MPVLTDEYMLVLGIIYAPLMHNVTLSTELTGDRLLNLDNCTGDGYYVCLSASEPYSVTMCTNRNYVWE